MAEDDSLYPTGGQPLKDTPGPESPSQAKARIEGTASSARDPFPKNAKGQLIAPDYVKKEYDSIMTALRKARPRILTNPVNLSGISPAIVGSYQTRETDWAQRGWGNVKREPLQPPFPAITPETIRQQQSIGTGIGNVSFLMSDASTVENNVTVNKVAILDGKINGEFPTGMGAGDLVLTMTNPANATVFAGATFDPTSLTLTSRFVQISPTDTPPESRIDEDGGFLYWQLGFTFLDDDGNFQIYQTRLGDINFELVYGELNAAPALLPVESGPGWLEVPTP